MIFEDKYVHQPFCLRNFSYSSFLVLLAERGSGSRPLLEGLLLALLLALSHNVVRVCSHESDPYSDQQQVLLGALCAISFARIVFTKFHGLYGLIGHYFEGILKIVAISYIQSL